MRRTARAPAPLLCLIGRGGGDQIGVTGGISAPSGAIDHGAGGDAGPSGQDSEGEAE